MAAAPFGLPEDIAFLVEPALLLPLGLSYRSFSRQQKDLAYTIRRMYLLENGQQIVLETYDGVLQRLNILQNDEYSHDSTGDGIVFTITNGERDFKIKTQGATLIDYDLTDRIVKGICVDTKKRGNLHHRIFERQ
jgi:hypothetical protein